MLKFDAVKPGVMKCPLAQSHNGKGAHTSATLVARSATAQGHLDSVVQALRHLSIHSAASLIESARRTCHRWIAGSWNASTTSAASPAVHGRNTAARPAGIDG